MAAGEDEVFETHDELMQQMAHDEQSDATKLTPREYGTYRGISPPAGVLPHQEQPHHDRVLHLRPEGHRRGQGRSVLQEGCI